LNDAEDDNDGDGANFEGDSAAAGKTPAKWGKKGGGVAEKEGGRSENDAPPPPHHELFRAGEVCESMYTIWEIFGRIYHF
jgi:hypothetical protein